VALDRLTDQRLRSVANEVQLPGEPAQVVQGAGEVLGDHQHEGLAEHGMALQTLVVLEAIIGNDDIHMTSKQRMAMHVGKPGGQGVVAGVALDRLDQRLAHRRGQ
jgi:hypothetical protein